MNLGGTLAGNFTRAAFQIYLEVARSQKAALEHSLALSCVSQYNHSKEVGGRGREVLNVS